ncbi:hypothetical protein [Streptomyces sp. CB02959]|uniref:hypothetical protein n=1 Tax=Streptomyces sp. CB02959 TaxID=2020330 RepID=UPI0011AFBF02|nr:hypothetical protein [Streptomyces sp. CB02959]
MLTALTPFVVRLDRGLSQALYKALYRLYAAHVRGHDPAEPLAKLASMNAERVKIPDTDDGRRLRDALRVSQLAARPAVAGVVGTDTAAVGVASVGKWRGRALGAMQRLLAPPGSAAAPSPRLHRAVFSFAAAPPRREFEAVASVARRLVFDVDLDEVRLRDLAAFLGCCWPVWSSTSLRRMPRWPFAGRGVVGVAADRGGGPAVARPVVRSWPCSCPGAGTRASIRWRQRSRSRGAAPGATVGSPG